MKILNQSAPALQLRPKKGLHLIYSPKPGNQAIKKSQTIRFPVLNSLTVWGSLQRGIPRNPVEVSESERGTLLDKIDLLLWHQEAATRETLRPMKDQRLMTVRCSQVALMFGLWG